ncbi:MAG: NAD(P)-dependent oxidoreductase [Candidatus Gastranaerophilales bacterium]|nr:NAD(P)-dependent oxidoreductase [Candidatus Gastranaerophilales bacterium]
MKNIVFFDAKDYEVDYFNKSLGDKFNLVYEKFALLPTTFIPREALDSPIISVFTTSRLSEKVLSQFGNLNLIATRSVGVSHIDLRYCKNHNITVVNTPHYGDYTVAEFAFGLLVDLVRKINLAQIALKAGDISQNFLGVELFGKTVGVIGTGGIGSKSIKMANGFSMNVLAYDIAPNQELESRENFKYVDLDTLIRASDIIMLFAPATVDNYHLLNVSQFSKMKNGVYIINTARGELIDTQALYNSLLSGKVAGAALDVLECEEALQSDCDFFQNSECVDLNCLKKTLINHKLLSLSNVIVTPHIAYDTKAATDRILEITANNIIAFNDNRNVENIVE